MRSDQLNFMTTIRSEQLNLINGRYLVTVITAIAALVGLAVGLDVVLAIFVLAAKLAAIAVVGIVEAATWIRVEGLAAP